jgi:hypothetical protein
MTRHPDCPAPLPRPPRARAHGLRRHRGLPATARALPLLAGLLGLLALFALACRPAAASIANGHDPFAALASPVPSEVWDLPFWVREQATGSALWRRSFAFCRGRSESAYPNCHTVRLASWWGTPPPLPPPPPPLAGLLGGEPRRTPPPAATPPARPALAPTPSGLASRPAGGRR